MQSSPLVFLRALIMLVCLVALPLAAIYGTSWADKLRAYLKTHVESPQASDELAPAIPLAAAAHPERSAMALPPREAPVVAQAILGESPPPAAFSPPGDPNQIPPAIATQPTGFPASGPIDRGERPHPPRYPADVPQDIGSRAPPLPYPTTIPPYLPPPAGERGIQIPNTAGTARPAATDGNVRLASAEIDTPSPATTGPAGHPGEMAGMPADFQQIQNRLQELGATYYRLETWGGKSLFRFHCRMAVNENSRYTRHFEATDPDPMVSMRRVLEQVETWRAGR